MRVELTGTLGADGTLTLDGKPAGPVRVVVEAVPAAFVPPKDDPFWRRMQAMWDRLDASGYVPRSAEEIDASLRELRDEWDERQQEIERIQQEGWEARRAKKETDG
ncbi:MAG: hypothetical protein ACRC33_08890 [Gemmataceae bacterium]